MTHRTPAPLSRWYHVARVVLLTRSSIRARRWRPHRRSCSSRCRRDRLVRQPLGVDLEHIVVLHGQHNAVVRLEVGFAERLARPESLARPCEESASGGIVGELFHAQHEAPGGQRVRAGIQIIDPCAGLWGSERAVAMLVQISDPRTIFAESEGAAPGVALRPAVRPAAAWPWQHGRYRKLRRPRAAWQHGDGAERALAGSHEVFTSMVGL